MSRQIQDKNSNISHISSANQIKLRVSPSPKNRPTRLGTRSLSKSPTQTFIHNNSKIGESNISKSRNLKSRKDTRAEVSPQERIELIQGSNYEGRQREKSLKQNILNNGSFVQNTNKKSQSQSGELIKKLVSKKRLKLNAQKDIGTKELHDKRSKQGLKKEEQEAVSNYLDLPNNFMASLSFAKNTQTSDLRKKEAKLSASLMSNPTDYKNIIHQSDSHLQSLTNVSRNASIYMLSRHGSHKFTDLEMESDLTEKRIGAYAKNLQDSDALSSNAYRLFKYQRLQEKAKLEAVNHPETQEVRQGSSSIIKSPIYSNKISPRKQSNEVVEPLDNTTENHKVSHKGNRPKKLKKRKKDGFSPNKSRNFSAAIGERSTEIYKNGMQSSNISQGQLINAGIFQNEISRQSPYILAENKDLYCEPASSSFVRKGKKDTCISPNNQQSVQIFQKERIGTEPKHRATAKMQAFFRENAMSPQRVVDLDQMNVKQLIELKNIIDEKIEVEELRNKTDHIKTEQKIKKAIKSQGDEKSLHKRSQFDDLEMRNQDENVILWDPTAKNLKKPDSFYEQVWRGKMLDQRIPRNNRQGVSFNISYMKESDLNMKHDTSTSQFNLNPSLQADSSKIGYSYSYVKEDRSLINSKSEIEGMYNQKLREFLEARDRMLQMTEASGEEVDLGKYSEIPNTASPMEIKSYNGFITLNNLLQMNSPGSLKESESQIIKQKERELLIQSMLGSPSANSQAFKHRFSNSCLENTQEYMETAKFEEDANTKGEEKQNKQFDFSSLKVQVRSAIQNNDLISLINQNDKRSKHKTEKTAPRHKSSEARSRLTKKDIKDLILKANEIEDTPSESIDDFEQKENYLRHNFGLSKDNLEHKSLAKILNSQFIAQDDISVPDTPATNLQNLDSKNTSSIVETDLSILAINKKLAMMRSDLD